MRKRVCSIVVGVVLGLAAWAPAHATNYFNWDAYSCQCDNLGTAIVNDSTSNQQGSAVPRTYRWMSFEPEAAGVCWCDLPSLPQSADPTNSFSSCRIDFRSGTVCNGGANAGLPCHDDLDCPSSTCQAVDMNNMCIDIGFITATYSQWPLSSGVVPVNFTTNTIQAYPSATGHVTYNTNGPYTPTNGATMSLCASSACASSITRAFIRREPNAACHPQGGSANTIRIFIGKVTCTY